MSVPVLIIMTSLGCINGLVLYAVYANCDPLTAKEIQRNNQVNADKRFEQTVKIRAIGSIDASYAQYN